VLSGGQGKGCREAQRAAWQAAEIRRVEDVQGPPRTRHSLKPDQRLRLSAYLSQHPALEVTYRFQQRLCYLLLKKHKTRRQCQKLVPRFLRAIVVLGDTLYCWSKEIARMWRFTRSNGITEGFHNKMGTISRQAYGFRNFENYRVQLLCSGRSLDLGHAPVVGVEPNHLI